MPHVHIPTFISSLFQKIQKPGPRTKQHQGLLHKDGIPIYDLDLAGKTP